MADNVILYICRHGATILNEKNEFRGDINAPLDAQGIKDAQILAIWFKDKPLSFIVSSDKNRTQKTAAIIASHHPGVPTAAMEEFRPWNIGNKEDGGFGGLPKNKENLEKLQEYIKNPSKQVPGGNSLEEFRKRISPILMEALLLAIKLGKPGLVVTHSSVVHEIGHIATGNHEAAHIKPGGVAIIYLKNGEIDARPIFRSDPRATSQNVLGTKNSSLTS